MPNLPPLAPRTRKRRLPFALPLCLALSLTLCLLQGARADLTRTPPPDPIVASVVEDLILPGFDALARRSATLAAQAEKSCEAEDPQLRAAYGAAFDAWIRVSHFRFGPSEVENRAFALAFWPDSRGKTPKALTRLLRTGDPAQLQGAAYRAQSVAAQGFYALELLIYDPAYRQPAPQACALIRANTGELARLSAEIAADWRDHHATALISPGGPSPYRSTREARQVLYKALATGLQLASELRLGRPLADFDRPRPARAEVRRSARSKRHLRLSLESLAALAEQLSQADPRSAAPLASGFRDALAALTRVGDPAFADVTDPMGWFRLDMVRLNIEGLRDEPMHALAQALGVGAGFNALDGD